MFVSVLVLFACSREFDEKTDVVRQDTGLDDTAADSDTDVVDSDGDGSPDDEDCDDADPDVFPGADERCNGKDDDCDGSTEDEGDADADTLLDCEDYCPVYAPPGAAGDGRPTDPVGMVQDAIDIAASSACYEVRAFAGTFEESVDFGGWPVNVESLSGPSETILQGDGTQSVVSFISGEDEFARLFGFTVTGGGGSTGAGIVIQASSPTVEGNTIASNATTELPHVGGGISTYDGSPLILDNRIEENDAGYGGPENGSDGGAIRVRGGAPWIEGNLLLNNTAGDGGAIWLAYSDAMILHNVIAENVADDVPDEGEEEKDGQGGGINVQVSGPDGPYILNNLVIDNTASWYGGGIVTYEDNSAYGEATIANNTILFNRVTQTEYGAGICQWRRTTPLITNNIVAWNEGWGVTSEDGIDATFLYNLGFGNDLGSFDGVTGTGNLEIDPKFVLVTNDGDWTNDDLTLKSTSPARDAGNPEERYNDADGSRNDLGAFGGPNGSWP